MTQLSLVQSAENPLVDRLAAARAQLAEKPDGVIEAVARSCTLPTQTVLELLPAEVRAYVPASEFENLWQEMTGWGDVLLIVHTPDIVLECVGSLPPGSFARGYFNIHGDSAIGGHIRAENCHAIFFVDRMFHGKRSCSVQFFNAAGEAMFKVFVRRDKERNLLIDQLERFETLRARFGQRQ